MWQKIKNQYHLGQAIFANIIYLFPSRKLKVIGVTGTDGKTTTASIIYHVLERSGYKVALISSIGAMINGKSSDIGYHVTTPGRFALQSYLKRAAEDEVEYVVLEITSHALDQYRAFGIPIEIGILTNVSNEHLDYHKTYRNYLRAKLKLLKKAKIAVINKDDKSYLSAKKELKNKKTITYGLKKDSYVNPHVFPFRSKLIGKFNVYNCLAAISALRELHVPDEKIRKGIESFLAPTGRQEIVYDKNFMIINDFAHTPNSFMNILPELKKKTKGDLIHVFGTAGKRDRYKRPEMGRISSMYSDVIILTAEDPRDEPVEKIISEIESGIKSGYVKDKFLYKIPNRKDAIEFAVSIAKSGDTVLLTGKGHEKSINYGKGEESWDENKTALHAVEMRNKK
jgi:UDP-N-acetylmuramoyl-L-alanyl-D-glutamate--2,6-diaminopimelate ligase